MFPNVPILVVLVAALWPSLESAAGAGPDGAWETHDDRTGARRAMVRISICDGELAGVIERLYLRPGEELEPRCARCKGSRHDRPVLGMEILRGHKRDGERWTGGSILDPENGKEYRSTVWLEGPDRLRVRGYWGPFYRTQTWQRSKADDEGLAGAGTRASSGRP